MTRRTPNPSKRVSRSYGDDLAILSEGEDLILSLIRGYNDLLMDRHFWRGRIPEGHVMSAIDRAILNAIKRGELPAWMLLPVVLGRTAFMGERWVPKDVIRAYYVTVGNYIKMKKTEGEAWRRKEFHKAFQRQQREMGVTT